ncbi:kinase-like domain-containing protein [Fimicolochytrium jonesii]|uniref:kinase-like domain-containing protein n=1 Tax=Fimicolochytrium jonesii TaxID=1396493 RepID=UPI0022FE2EA4|nr:kinase-like domain-containing protein [Fimicolochytrium jonesii]KAI8820259.1 kinase-like domain-containing protein [Fimicolochytrium jonesii]
MSSPWGHLASLNGPLAFHTLPSTHHTLGTAPTCDISLPTAATSISQHHCRLLLLGDMPCLENLSPHGTYVDGKHVEGATKVSLTNGAEIRLGGDTFFVFTNLLEDPKLGVFEGRVVGERYYVFGGYELGKGSFATVRLSVDLKTGERLACKVIQRGKGAREREREGRKPSSGTVIARETAILKNIMHPNLVQVKEVVRTEECVYLFLTRVTGGELFYYVQKHGGMEEHAAKFVFYQILLAVQYLHNLDITHRDLKLENILMESSNPFGRILVSDLGLAKMLGTSLSRMRTQCGTLTYVAPEVLASSGTGGDGYGKCVDCWSLGVLLYTMLSGTLPFGTDSDGQLLATRIKRAEYDLEGEEWERVSPEGKHLITSLLTHSPSARLTISGALSHPWITKRGDLLRLLYRKMIRRSPDAGRAEWVGREAARRDLVRLFDTGAY